MPEPRIAIVFPGQGSQKVGMGAELAQRRPDLWERHVLRAQSASGLPLARLCLEGPLEALTRTEVAQPALFALGSALHEIALEAGVRPGFVAGHSLGEYTAAVAAGALSAQDGLELVCERGRLMAEVQAQRPGAMGAVIGLPTQAVIELCATGGDVEPANLNAPTQTVVSGAQEAVAELLARASAAGAEKAVPLQVGAAFHSHAMRSVQREMAQRMRHLEWHDPEVALASNASGTLAHTAAQVHEALVAQIASPVQWVACVEALLAAGAERFLELGPGRVLTGLLKRIAPEATGVAADGPEKVERQGQKLTHAV